MTSGRVTMETTFARFNIIDGESYASQHTILPNGWKKAKFVGCKIKRMDGRLVFLSSGVFAPVRWHQVKDRKTHVDVFICL